jgi:PilZ domain
MCAVEPRADHAGSSSPTLREARRRDRLNLRLPVRLRWWKTGAEADDIQITSNFNRHGLHFKTPRDDYQAGMKLRVTFPYCDGAVSRDYAGQVVRVEPLSGGGYGVAVRFLYIESQAAKAASARA